MAKNRLYNSSSESSDGRTFYNRGGGHCALAIKLSGDSSLTNKLSDGAFCPGDILPSNTSIVKAGVFSQEQFSATSLFKLIFTLVSLSIIKIPSLGNIELVKTVPPCSHTHSPCCLILQPNLPQCLSCCLTCFGWS